MLFDCIFPGTLLSTPEGRVWREKSEQMHLLSMKLFAAQRDAIDAAFNEARIILMTVDGYAQSLSGESTTSSMLGKYKIILCCIDESHQLEHDRGPLCLRHNPTNDGVMLPLWTRGVAVVERMRSRHKPDRRRATSDRVGRAGENEARASRRAGSGRGGLGQRKGEKAGGGAVCTQTIEIGRAWRWPTKGFVCSLGEQRMGAGDRPRDQTSLLLPPRIGALIVGPARKLEARGKGRRANRRRCPRRRRR